MDQEPELDPTLTEKDLLFRIARELKTIRIQNTELLRYARDAESEVPESLRRFANYMHDVHDIIYIYESRGHPCPAYVTTEIERLDDRYRQILKSHNLDGGAIEKIRREMAADPENRWDHTRQLSKPKEQVK